MIGWADLRREPFRVLFPLGAVFGMFGVGHWLGFALGLDRVSSGFYHASVQVTLFMCCFIAGFLMTAIPRFASAPPASSVELLGALGLLVINAIGLALRQWWIAQAAFIGLLALLAAFAVRRFARRQGGGQPPTEFVWIGVAVLHGIVGAALLIAGEANRVPAWVANMGRLMLQQGFLFGIILGVGGFMAPRLLGRPGLLVTPTGVSMDAAQHIRRRRIRIHLLAAVAFFASFLIEGRGVIRAAYLLRALVVTAELAWTTQWYRPPTAPGTYVRLLWLSLWLIVVGFWGVVVWPTNRVGWLHVSLLGGVSLMTFAVATMVILSHGGEAPRLQRGLGILRWLGGAIGLSVALRLAAQHLPSQFLLLLGLSAASWIAGVAAWLLYVIPRVLRRIAPEEFERMHEEAKQRLRTAAC